MVAASELDATLGRLERLAALAPDWYGLVDLDKATSSAWLAQTQEIGLAALDFDDSADGGRGDLYRVAQQDTYARERGIRALCALALSSLPTRRLLLDVLGGDGLIARVLGDEAAVLTSDLAPAMVDAALAQGLPALRQPAQSLCLHDASVDAVLIAYGSHHIPLADRERACQEAWRVLRSGGRLVLHDFESGGPVASWFGEIVHSYSATGHDFPHYERLDMERYLSTAGFSDVAVHDLYDPFCLRALSPGEARRSLGHHLAHMYGLVKLIDEHGEQAPVAVTDLAEQYFRYPAGHASGALPLLDVSGDDEQGYTIELPRVALVAVGVKP